MVRWSLKIHLGARYRNDWLFLVLSKRSLSLQVYLQNARAVLLFQNTIAIFIFDKSTRDHTDGTEYASYFETLGFYNIYASDYHLSIRSMKYCYILTEMLV